MADSWDDRAVADSDDNHDMPGTGHATSTLTESDWSPHDTTVAAVYDFNEIDDPAPPGGQHFVAPAVKELLTEPAPSRRRAADTVAAERPEPGARRAATALVEEDPQVSRKWSRSAKAAVAAGGMLVTACAVGALALVAFPDDTEDFASFLPSSPPRSAVADDATTSASATTSVSLAAGCVPTSSDRIFTTDAAGGRASAQQVIAELNYAYYVLRNGAAVAALYDPALRMDPVALQAAIDSTPIGTTHCVTVTPGGYPGVSAVELTETRPGDPPTIIRQTIETKDAGGTYMITAVTQ